MRFRTELKAALLLTDLAQSGSIGKTAGLHNLAPSTVLRHLRALEKLCGSALLMASPTGTTLTEAGRRLAAQFDREITASLTSVDRLPYKSLRIWLDPRLQCPMIWTILMRWAIERTSDLRLTDVAAGADLVLSLDSGQDPATAFSRVFTAAPGYLTDTGIPYSSADLSIHTLIVCENDIALFQRTDCRRRLVVPTLAAGLTAAENGLGLLYGITAPLIERLRQAGALSLVPFNCEETQNLRIISSSVATAELQCLLLQTCTAA